MKTYSKFVDITISSYGITIWFFYNDIKTDKLCKKAKLYKRKTIQPYLLTAILNYFDGLENGSCNAV